MNTDVVLARAHDAAPGRVRASRPEAMRAVVALRQQVFRIRERPALGAPAAHLVAPGGCQLTRDALLSQLPGAWWLGS